METEASGFTKMKNSLVQRDTWRVVLLTGKVAHVAQRKPRETIVGFVAENSVYGVLGRLGFAM